MNKYASINTFASFKNGFAFKSKNYTTEGIRIIRISNVQDGKIIDKNPKFYAENSIKDYSEYLLEDGDLLMSLTGDVGRVGFINKELLPAYLNQRVLKIECDEKVILKKYLFYFFKSPKIYQKIIAMSKGVAQLNVSARDIFQLQIPVLSLQEQEKVVEKLDKVFNNVDLNLKNTEHTDFEIDKLFTSIIHEIFLEKEVRLGNLIELNYGKGLDKKERGDKYKIPLYGSNGIMDFASKPLYDGKSVIVGRKGSVGELQYVEVPFWVIDVGFYVTLTNKDHLMRYYYYLLKSLNLQNLSTGVKPGLNRNKVYEILVPKHDLNQQKKIVDKLDKLFLLKHQMQNLSIKKTASNTSLKRSILNKEFSYE